MADPTWWKRPFWGLERFGHLTFEEIEGPERATELRARRATVVAGPVSPLEEVGPLDPPAPDHVLLRLAVGMSGELIALWCNAADVRLFDRTADRRKRSESGHRVFRPGSLTITADSADGARIGHVRVPEVNLTDPIISAAPDGSFAIVSTVCELRHDGPDSNGIVVDAHGTVLNRVMLGDGVNIAQSTPSGKTWVGYSDTGIFGNNGWGFTGHTTSAERTPIGVFGLVRFDATYAIEWEFGRAWYEVKKPDRETIDHVYALNVIDETAWLYYYSQCSIARVHDNDIRIWNTNVELANQLLISDDRAALIGGHGPEYDRIVHGHLDRTDLGIVSVGRIVLPDGSDLPTDIRTTSRGSTLQLIADNTWYRLDL